MSAGIPDPVPTVCVSTQPVPTSASFAVQGLGLLMTDAWVRQSHTPLQHHCSHSSACFQPPCGNTLGFPSDQQRLSVFGHVYVYEAAAVTSVATSCAVNDLLTAYDVAQFAQHVCVTGRHPRLMCATC